LVEIATAVRRYKSQNGLPLGAGLDCLQVAIRDPSLANALGGSFGDLVSITRARQVELMAQPDPALTMILDGDALQVAITPHQPV
jgi:hypothetical protein